MTRNGSTTDYDSRAEYATYAYAYDLLYGDHNDDFGFYLNCAKQYVEDGGSILELGMGTGRLSAYLAGAGYRIVGIDNSKEMIKLGQWRKWRLLRERIKPVPKDVRDFDLNRNFRLIIAPFAMVAHLMSDQDRLRAFRCVRKHLAPGGVFVFDEHHGGPAWAASKDPLRLEIEKQFIEPKTGRTVRLLSNYVQDARRSILVRDGFVDWLEDERVIKRIELRISFRNVSVKEDCSFLKRAGFRDIKVLGNWDDKPSDCKHPEKSQRTIVLASAK